MRGKGTVEKDGEPWFGITPAYAGKRAFCGELEKAG